MEVKLGETIHLDCCTHNPSTGAVTDADSAPTCEVFEDATDAPILSGAMTKRTSKTGNYRVALACTTGNGFESGKSYNVVVSATVSSVTGKSVIARFIARSYLAADLQGEVHLAKAAALNKQEHNQALGQRKIYDDDGTTVLALLNQSSNADGSIITETPA